MTTITDSYRRLADETGRPCYSITLWQTVDGRWGARAGLGEHEFGDTADAAIEAAVTNAISAQRARNAATYEPKAESPVVTEAAKRGLDCIISHIAHGERKQHIRGDGNGYSVSRNIAMSFHEDEVADLLAFLRALAAQQDGDNQPKDPRDESGPAQLQTV